MALTLAELKRERKRLESEEAKREQQKASEATMLRFVSIAAWRAWRREISFERHEQGYNLEETAFYILDRTGIVVTTMTVSRDIKRVKHERAYEAYAAVEGHTRTKIPVVHGSEVYEVEDGTLKEALKRLRGRLTKKS